MISIQRLSELDMENFKNKKILLYSHMYNRREIEKIFRFFNIEILGHFAEIVPSRFEVIKGKIQGIPYINEYELEKLIKENDDLIIQVMGSVSEDIERFNKKIELLGGNCSSLPSGLIVTSFNHLVMSRSLSNPVILFGKKIRRIEFFWKKSNSKLNDFYERKYKKSIIICSPPKTGDYTLIKTFENHNEKNEKDKINYINVWHRPEFFNKNILNKKKYYAKIIIGIREPISTNVSHLYQRMGVGYNVVNPFLEHAKLFNHKFNKKMLKEYEKKLREKGDDAQVLWDVFLECYMNSKKTYNNEVYIQFVIPKFQKYVLDFLDYPFDKEKGYSIIKEGNTEVFVYQLEKLNGLISELSEFVGVNFDSLVRGNQSSDKWVGESYRQALKEIKITQEYFDKCYNEPYVNHCYSKDDIEKFKEKWKSHII